MKKLWAAWDKVVAMRREAGVPGTCLEARQAGLSDAEWNAMLDKTGLLFHGDSACGVQLSGQAAGL